MSSTVEELTIEYTDEGVVTVKELAKVVLSKGAWATVMFKYQDLDRKTEKYGPTKYSIRRYQKKNNEYRQKSKFNISSNDQAKKIIETLNLWMADDETVS